MDKEKTGALIAAQRKAKNMTQDELASKLYVTGKAVSKWERGLSFPGIDLLAPLADALEITVLDLLAGEILSSDALPKKSAEISVTALQNERRGKLYALIFAILAVVLLVIAVIQTGVFSVIFQRGNPIPYLAAAMQISDDTPFVQVDADSVNDIYIAVRGDCPELFDMIEETRGVTFSEQAGSGFIFTNGADSLTVSSEIYWGRWTVWSVPAHTLASP